jgi:aldehyde dehydrogenase (NAD+)
LIERGIAEGAELVAGGPGRPSHLNAGYYVRPTVFARVTNQMTIAREEIFGPVLSIIGYDSEDEAIAIANDTPYGLAAYIQGDPKEARALAGRLRSGTVRLNSSESWALRANEGIADHADRRRAKAPVLGQFLLRLGPRAAATEEIQTGNRPVNGMWAFTTGDFSTT